MGLKNLLGRMRRAWTEACAEADGGNAGEPWNLEAALKRDRERLSRKRARREELGIAEAEGAAGKERAGLEDGYSSVWSDPDPDAECGTDVPAERAEWLMDAESKLKLLDALKPGDWVEWVNRGRRDFALFCGRLPENPGLANLVSPGHSHDVHFLLLVRKVQEAEKAKYGIRTPLQ